MNEIRSHSVGMRTPFSLLIFLSIAIVNSASALSGEVLLLPSSRFQSANEENSVASVSSGSKSPPEASSGGRQAAAERSFETSGFVPLGAIARHLASPGTLRSLRGLIALVAASSEPQLAGKAGGPAEERTPHPVEGSDGDDGDGEGLRLTRTSSKMERSGLARVEAGGEQEEHRVQGTGPEEIGSIHRTERGGRRRSRAQGPEVHREHEEESRGKKSLSSRGGFSKPTKVLAAGISTRDASDIADDRVEGRAPEAGPDSAETQLTKKQAVRENRRPVIGMFTHPFYGIGVHPKGDFKPPAKASMIAASYVRLVQAAGGQVVPIFYDSSPAELRKAFGMVNMLFFQGGFVSLHRKNLYYRNAKRLFDMAIKKNDEGEYFPIHGSCLGLELLASLVADVPRSELVEETEAEGHPAVLRFGTRGARGKAMFSFMEEELLEKLTSTPLTMENHKWGIMPHMMYKNDRLSDFYEVLTTSPDQNGKWYVSTMKAYSYPVTATQWHAEKPPYEFYSAFNVPHRTDAIRVSTAFSYFVVEEARKNPSRANRTDIMQNVVDNYKFWYTANLEGHEYDAVYIFPLRADREAATSGAR